MKFNCETEISEKKENWKAEITRFINYGSHYEIFIESRSSILVLLGKTSRGGFAAMPDFEVGCHLVNLKDKFWNSEKLCSILGKIDGVTVATALYELSNQHTFIL